jgi:hypothetical protein
MPFLARPVSLTLVRRIVGEVFVFIKQTFSFHRLVILRLQFHVRQIENVEKPEKNLPGYAAWEIHPVMNLNVQ